MTTPDGKVSRRHGVLRMTTIWLKDGTGLYQANKCPQVVLMDPAIAILHMQDGCREAIRQLRMAWSLGKYVLAILVVMVVTVVVLVHI